MKYDWFQTQSIKHISEGHSVIVSAPTGAGKTVIAEHVIEQCIKRREKVIYTAPIKALSNQKYRDFKALDQTSVGILTGDVTLDSNASVLIMTTEIFRNKILEDASTLKEYSWIIFDEIHYIDDWERGTVWEESLIFMPDHMRFLGLSATIPNVDELKNWLESIHPHKVKIVKENKRPVPLHFYFQCQNNVYDDIETMAKKGYSIPGYRHTRGGKLPRSVNLRANKLYGLIKKLETNKMLPCIYFVFSRKRCELLASELEHFNFLNPSEQKRIVELFNELCRRYELTHEPSAAELQPLIRRGIAYHHAGMLPTLKEVVEQLFTNKLLKVIFTTETFALGINMPAKAVVFDELRKYYGRETFGNLKTRDFYQMAGRAGRRSIDTEGHVFCRINPHFISTREVEKIIYSEPEKVNSQFNASYATVLNLYNKYKDDLYDVYPRSFHFFQSKQHDQKMAVYFLRAKVDILTELGFIRRGELTQKGQFASKVYGYEMILSELFEDGTLEKLSMQQLAVLCIALVYEPRKGAHKPDISKQAHELESRTRHIIKKIHRLERTVRLTDLSKRGYYHITPAIEAWINQKDFNYILSLGNADEGEIVRYFRMTVQLLREIADGPVSETLKEKIFKLLPLINRDVIDSEKQLRI